MRIDVTKIEGYESLSVEEKLAALEAYEYDDHSTEIADLDKYKDAVTKANHEAAELKKQVKTLQDQQKTGNSKADTTIAELQRQVADLTRQNTIASYTAQFTALGYDAELAHDARVCIDCAVKDGKIYPLDKAPMPPMHYNCRCRLIPVLKK